MRKIDKLIIHCSATHEGMDIGVKEINQWHIDRGFNKIGYHYVIRRDGTIEDGRPLDEVGAHVKGYNTGSIGICLVGGVDRKLRPVENFTPQQWKALRGLLKILKADYKNATIHGHNEFDNKACPSFIVEEELRAGRLTNIG